MPEIILMPAVLSAKEAYAYVGGILIWKELAKKHPTMLPPFRTLKRGDTFYLRTTIDLALQYAEDKGSLLTDVKHEDMKLVRQNRRLNEKNSDAA